MRRILKYQVEVTDMPEVSMARGAKILTVQVQRGRVCIWADTESDEPVVTRRLRMVGTGHEHDGVLGMYVGTVQLHDGGLVFHVFDLGEA